MIGKTAFAKHRTKSVSEQPQKVVDRDGIEFNAIVQRL